MKSSLSGEELMSVGWLELLFFHLEYTVQQIKITTLRMRDKKTQIIKTVNGKSL